MIDARYREYLADKVLMEYLREGKIPKASQLAEDLQAQLQAFPDQSRPLAEVSQTDFLVEEHQTSSAARFNRFLATLAQDLEVLQQECLALETRQNHMFARNLREIRMLSSQLRRLEHQLNSYLLVHRETVGYGSYLADNFADASLIDLARTTAALDLQAHCVTLSPVQGKTLEYPTSQIRAEDVQVEVLTRLGLVRAGVNQQNLQKAFTDAEEAWRMQLYYDRTDQEVIVEVKIKVSAQPVVLNRINFKNHNLSPYRTRLDVLASLDDYNWGTLGERYLGAEADLRFADTEVKWLKFRFTKDHSDYQQGALFVYEYGIRALRLSRVVQQENEGVFYSKALSLTDSLGQPRPFSQVSLEVCEDVPPGTDIQYELSFDGGRTFSPIAPLGRTDQGSLPYVVELNQVVQVETPAFGLDLTTPYHYQGPDYILLSYALPEDHVPGSLRLWRNLGTKGRSTPVRGGLSGWRLDGQYYACTVQVANADGLTLNLGPTTMEINGVPRTGSVLLSPGVYTIRSARNFWSPLHDAGGRAVTHLTQVTERGDGTFQGRRADGFRITVRDPLYPYNHKLLVEGLDYELTAAAAKEVTYRGADLFAETLMRQTSEVNLVHHPDYAALDYYALTPVVTPQGTEWRFLVRYSPLTGSSGDRFDLEVFKAFYQRPREGQADTVVLKAALSRRPEVTASPSLFYYIVKLA